MTRLPPALRLPVARLGHCGILDHRPAKYKIGPLRRTCATNNGASGRLLVTVRRIIASPGRCLFYRAGMAAVVASNGLEPLRPALKWAGGKRWLLPRLRELWISADAPRLVEPFCGGLSVALGLMPSRALLNDINPHAINFYRWLKKGLRIDLDMSNDPDAYYAARAMFNNLIDSQSEKTSEA